MAQSLAAITHKLLLPNWKSEACKNCKGALLQSSLIFYLISHVCNCTWTGEGLNLFMKIIQKGILEAIPVLYIKSSKIKEGRNFCLLLSNSRTCYPLTNFFPVRTISWCVTYILLQLYQNSLLGTHLELHVTRCRKTSCLEQPKISPCNNCTGEVLQFLTRESLWNFGWKLWNRAIKIMAYNSSIKTNTKHFWVELSAAFTEEADLCMQQRNHFKHNQRN